MGHCRCFEPPLVRPGQAIHHSSRASRGRQEQGPSPVLRLTLLTLLCQRRNKSRPAGRRKTRPVCGVGVEQDVPCPPRRKWPGFRSRVGRGFGGRPGEKTVFQVLARPQQGKGCLDRGDLTPLADPLLRGRPSSTVQIDCILNQNDAHFPQAVGRPGQPKGPAAAVAPSPLHLAGCGRWSILIISDWAVRCATLSSDARRADATQIDGRLLRTGIASRPDARSMVLCLS
jgi:hypothetical protein